MTWEIERIRAQIWFVKLSRLLKSNIRKNDSAKKDITCVLVGTYRQFRNRQKYPMRKVMKHFNKLPIEMINSMSFLNQNWKLPFCYIHVVDSSTDGCISLPALPKEVMLCDFLASKSIPLLYRFSNRMNRGEREQPWCTCASMTAPISFITSSAGRRLLCNRFSPLAALGSLCLLSCRRICHLSCLWKSHRAHPASQVLPALRGTCVEPHCLYLWLTLFTE